MLDVAGTQLTAEDRKRLLHPLVGGVILFSRNFESCEQLQKLNSEIHALRSPALIIAVDHEGGRVQRFREGFTRLPPMRELGLIWDRDRRHAAALAREVGFILAAELRVYGVDLSFAPVLDVDYGNSSVIGDRAFHSKADAVWGVHLHWMAVTSAQYQFLALNIGAIAHANDLQLEGVALAHTLHHVGHQGAAEAMALPGAAVAAGRRHQLGVAFLADRHTLRQGAAEFALGTFNGDVQPVQADADLIGHLNRGFTNTRHGSISQDQ